MNNPLSSSGFSQPSPAPQEQNLPTFKPLEPIPSTGSKEYPDYGIEIVSPPDSSIEDQIIQNRQRVVLELLINGQGIATAARLANVHRSTIHRWMKSDVQFRAALQ